MCGIAGFLSPDKNKVPSHNLQQTLRILQHRGPDSQGVWTNEKGTVSFAHTRLSIIDLSNCAQQPLHYVNRYVIIYNGEIYNYLELKKTLQQKGYSFTSTSDTEVIVAAYAAYGKDCLQHFDGMFAFAIWDNEKEELFAARDRFGEKPFFFFYDTDRFYFASEMKALWQAGIAKETNNALLYNFINLGYTANPTDPQETFYSNIYKLPAASFLTYSLKTHALQIEKYWQITVSENNSITEAQAIEQFQHLLQASVKKRLRSDVALGTSLSGGLDSSTIVALSAGEFAQHDTHKCFTAIFPGFDKNEQQLAAEVAATFNLQNITVAIDENEVPQLMDKVMYYQEEPVTSASVLAQYKVYEAAKNNGVTVLLDGQGADEILGGYTKYYKWLWQQLYRQKRLAQSGELKAAHSMGIKESFGLQHKMAALFPEFAAALLQTKQAKKSFSNPHINRDFALANKQNSYYTLPTTFDLNGTLFYNTFTYGLEELLRFADRNSMAHSVEVRLPFLQHQLVEFVFSLPAHFKIHQGYTKWLLRKSMEKTLPSSIVWRKEKVGFEPPQKLWMQNKQVADKIYEAKKKLVNNHVLSPQTLNKYTPESAHAAGNYDWRFWSASFL